MHTPTPAHACTDPLQGLTDGLFDDLNREFAQRTHAMAKVLAGIARDGAGPQTLALSAHVRQPRYRSVGSSFWLIGPNGDEDNYDQLHACPDGWRKAGVPWHPSHWRRYSDRVDQHGKKWYRCDDNIYVQDDFGTLVPVESAA